MKGCPLGYLFLKLDNQSDKEGLVRVKCCLYFTVLEVKSRVKAFQVHAALSLYLVSLDQFDYLNERIMYLIFFNMEIRGTSPYHTFWLFVTEVIKRFLFCMMVSHLGIKLED